MATLNNLNKWKGSEGKLIPYAWPGGYPVIYYTKDGCLLCPDCAQQSLDDPDESDPPTQGDIYYEGPMTYCADCNAEIESAHDDPDSKETAYFFLVQPAP